MWTFDNSQIWEKYMLRFPSPCPHCGKENENKWCYTFISKDSDYLAACKRNGVLSLNKGEWEKTESKDSEGTILYRRKLRKLITPSSTNEYIYRSRSTGENLVLVVRHNDGKGGKWFRQYRWDGQGWISGLNDDKGNPLVDRSDIALYRHKEILERLNSGEHTVYVCEGEKTADLLFSLGLLATTHIGGAGKWRDSDAQCLSMGRKIFVVLVPDCDLIGLKHMNKVCQSLLKNIDCQVKWVYPYPNNKMWRQVPESHGYDAADWIWDYDIKKEDVEHAITDKIVDESTEPDSDNDKTQDNRILTAIKALYQGDWISFDGSVYSWCGSHYDKKESSVEKKRIWKWLSSNAVVLNKKKVFNPTPADVNKIWESVLYNFAVDPKSVNPAGINCKNGILNIEWDDKTPRPVFTKHTSNKYYTYVSKVDYRPDISASDCDQLMECLEPDSRKIFFQLLGSSLDLPTVRRHRGRIAKAAILQGSGSNGKDSVRQCLELICGKLGTASISDFQSYDMGRKFTLAKLSGKKINWCSENKGSIIDNIQSLKAAITGESLDMEMKGRDEREMECNLIFLFNVNKAPSIKSGIEAIMSRFCVIDFPKTFKKNADVSRGEIEANPSFRYDFEFLANKVCPAFLNYMIEGLQSLMVDGIDYKLIEHNIKEIQENSNHLWRFVNDTNLGYGNGMTSTRELWDSLKHWYYQTGTLEIDEVGKEIWHEQNDKTDKNIKGVSQVRSRFLEMFPKCTIKTTRTASQRTTFLEGIVFHKSDEPPSNGDDDGNPPDDPNTPNGSGNGNTGILYDSRYVDDIVDILYEQMKNRELPETPNTVVELENEYDAKNDVVDVVDNPYDATTIVKGKLVVDESKIDIYRIPEKMKTPEFKPKELTDYENLGILYLDIETTGIDPSEHEIISIGVKAGQKHHFLTKKNLSEDEIIESFLRLVEIYVAKHYRILIGHHVFGFDLDFILNRAIIYDIRVPFQLETDKFGYKKRKITASSVNGQPIEFQNIIWPGIDIIDTFHLVGMYDKMMNCLPSYGLKDSAINLGLRLDRRTELSYQEILSAYESDNWDLINEYLMYDLDDTNLLADFLLPQIYYQLSVVPNITLQMLTIASPAKKWELIIEHYYKTIGIYHRPEPDIKLKYNGGIVGVNPGLYRNCAKIDVSGMYPSIQRLYNLKSSKDVHGIYLSVLNFLTEERNVLKAKYKETKASKYNAMQTSYKILNNGGYGFTGTGGYPYNCMATAALVTAYGRKIVKEMMEGLEDLGAKIIEVDTDGIYFQSDNQVEIFNAVQESLPDGIKIDLEHQGVDIYCPLMKNYLIFDSCGVKVKGSKFKSRNKCSLLKEFPINYVRHLFNSVEDATEYLDGVTGSLADGSYPVEELTVKQRIPKNSKALIESGLGNIGDVVSYYYGGEVTQRGSIKQKPVSDGDYLAAYYIREINKLKKEIDDIVMV